MRRATTLTAILALAALGLAAGVGRADDETPFSKRGTPKEREEKLASAIRATAQYSFNYSGDSLDVVKLADKLLEDHPKEIEKIDMGKLVPQAAREVAKQYPKSYFFFQIPTAEKDTPFKAVSDLLGKEDRSEKDTISIAGNDVAVTWRFYGWCGFGAAQDGKVYALKVECKDVPIKEEK